MLSSSFSAGGLAAAALTIPTNAATVNGSAISQNQLNADITAIANSRDYQCYLNAQAYVESQGQQLLAPVDGVGQTPGSGMHPTATTAFVAPLRRYRDQPCDGGQPGGAARPAAVTAKEVDAARSELSTQITQTMSEVSQVPNASVTCAPAPTLTGPVVLATMPASFVTQTATFDATVGLLEGHLSGADTTAGLMSVLQRPPVHLRHGVFHRGPVHDPGRRHQCADEGGVRHTVRASGGGRRHRERSSGVRHLVRHCVAAPGGDQPADAGRQSGLGADLHQRELPPAGDHLAHADLVRQGHLIGPSGRWNDWARPTR